MPPPSSRVNESVELSAITSACPDTCIVLNTSSVLPPEVPVFVIVIVSLALSVVRLIPEPATKVNVSEFESPTTSFCPEI